jgi:hypothetical protein
LVEFTGIFLPPSWHWEITEKLPVACSLLAGLGRCPPWFGNTDVCLHLRLTAVAFAPSLQGREYARVGDAEIDRRRELLSFKIL